MGLMFWGASNNTIYHNNFINNPAQAGEASLNRHSSLMFGMMAILVAETIGATTRPNTPNAAEIDNSGIGNTPYVIDSTEQGSVSAHGALHASFVLNYEQEIIPPKISLLSPINQKYNE